VSTPNEPIDIEITIQEPGSVSIEHTPLPNFTFGVPGVPGPPGPAGAAGAPGTNGAPGAPGENGADGKSAYQVAVDNGFSGTEANWLASLKGADGAPGPAGSDGAPGAPGTNGQDGADGAPGVPGVDGRSAYEVAVDNGFVGTEAQWLDSLVGPEGPQGPPGEGGAGSGLPAGGTTGQYLRKNSATDGDASWTTFPVSPTGAWMAPNNYSSGAVVTHDGYSYMATASHASNEQAPQPTQYALGQSVTGTPSNVINASSSVGDAYANPLWVNIGSAGTPYVSEYIDNANATLETSEPSAYVNGIRSVWWRYTPLSSGSLTVDTRLTRNIIDPQVGVVDTQISIYDGGFNANPGMASLTRIGQNEDFNGAKTSQVTVAVSSSQNYFIQVTQNPGQSLQYVLRVSGPVTRVANAGWMVLGKTATDAKVVRGVKMSRNSFDVTTAASGSRNLASVFDTISRNEGYTVNVGAGTITVPADGWYMWDGRVRFAGAISADASVSLIDTTSQVVISRGSHTTGGLEVHESAPIYLSMGQTVALSLYTGASTGVVGNADKTYSTFSLVSMQPI